MQPSGTFATRCFMPSPPTPSSCSLYCLIARKSSKAVIFRRGPSNQTCLISWDRSTDRFEVGQWFKGRVYPDRSDISADGCWLLVFMGNFRTPFATWTVLSKPPYFSAVALWAKGDAWGGGGKFLGDNEIVLSRDDGALITRGRLPGNFKAHPWSEELSKRLAAAYAKDERIWTGTPGQYSGPYLRNGNGAQLTMSFNYSRRRGSGRDFHFLRGEHSVALEGADWAEFDDNGDLLFSRGGGLYRLGLVRFSKVTSFEALLGEAKLLADFSGLTFQPVAAPYPAMSARAGRAGDGGGGATDEAGYMDHIDGRVSKEDRRNRARAAKAARVKNGNERT